VHVVTAAAPTSSPSAPLAPGYKLDRYELLCPIAEGGMASVWVARQRGKHGFEKLVAIKTILPKFAADERFQQMFLDEARIASRIEHVNVAQILDLGEQNDVLYLAMDYVDGDALSKLNRACQKKGVRIPTGIVLRVLADTCAGLHEAHELKDSAGKPLEIVHRDVSPHNILVSTKGIAKLIDFGIAKARSRVGSDTNSGVLKGKIHYMAPEQALGRPVDRRADVWAIGAILYHLLAGRPPYEGDNHLATLHLLGSGRPPVPLPGTVHPAIAAVVRKALSHAPDRRHETAADLRAAIEEAMLEAAVPATAADVAVFSAQYLAERTEKRRKAVETALAAAAERHRMEDLLKPASERSSSGVVAAGGAAPPPSSSTAALPSARDMTAPEVPAALSRLTARISEPPPNARSDATLGSTALDASEPTRSRKPLFAVLSMVVIAAAAATGVSFHVCRTRAATRAAAGAPPPPPAAAAEATARATAATPSPATSAAESVAPATSAAPAASAAPQASGSAHEGIPTMAATALPRAGGHRAAPAQHGVSRATGATAASAPPKSAPPAKNGTPDDGF
jgi:serine/threonine protein kinase